MDFLDKAMHQIAVHPNSCLMMHSQAWNKIAGFPFTPVTQVDRNYKPILFSVGDIIIAIHGKPIPNVHQLAMNMYSYAVGDKVEIEVLRGEKKLSFAVPVVEKADDPAVRGSGHRRRQFFAQAGNSRPHG